MMKPRLILCSGVRVPEGSALREGRRVVELDTLSPDSNTHLRLYNVTDTFARQLPDRFVDLLEMAAYVYTADCEANRELAWVEDKSTEQWSRDFHFVMPVRDLEFWQRSDVQTSLIKALDHLSSDRYEFDFRRLDHDRARDPYLDIGDEDLSPIKGTDRVIMFSGGLDSLAGAVETARRGEPLLLVSHTPVSSIKGRQRDLFLKLRETYAVPMMHIPIWVNKSGYDKESTQRSRSFLFSALGATVAKVLGVGGVRFYENGVISLNLPIAEEALRSRASRTTNPWSLHLLQEFYRLVADQGDFIIDNPYIFNTKAEVVSKIVESGAAGLIGHTCSCSHTMYQSKTQRHCGRCGQCIDRRIAILATGQEENDTDTDYEACVFTGERPLNRERPYDHNIAVNYVRFAHDINGMSENGVAKFYGTELARAARGFADRNEATRRFIAMHRRHAETVRAILDDQFKLHSRSFVDRSIGRSSLLYMAVAEPDTGSPDIPAGTLELARSTDGNMFRRTGDFWTIRYNGSEIQLRDSKGIRYLASLLARPGEEFYALQLIREVDGTTCGSDSVYSAMSAEELSEYGLSVSGLTDAGEIMDERYETDCRNRLKEALEKLRLAKARNDTAETSQASREVDHYRRALDEGIGLSGRHRTQGNPNEKARTSVSHAVGRVLSRLREQLPALHEHFSVSLQTGIQCSYSPRTPIHWNL